MALLVRQERLMSRGSKRHNLTTQNWVFTVEFLRGHVNNRFHPDHGYKGPMPKRGEKAEPAKRVDSAHFKGNEEQDGRGHVTGGKR